MADTSKIEKTNNAIKTTGLVSGGGDDDFTFGRMSLHVHKIADASS